MMSKQWQAADIPNLSGKRVLITGANSGIGYHTALKLARKGAHILFACRDKQRGEDAMERLHNEAPSTDTELVLIDLASLDSVRRFAESYNAQGHPLHILINNAGVMAPPRRLETADGYELQFGTNVLGHFALTGLLMPALQRAASTSSDRPRIVNVASLAHRRARINFDDLQSQKEYSPRRAYQQSKLANLLFTHELDKRLRACKSPIMGVSAHPGIASTNLFLTGEFSGKEKAIRHAIYELISVFLNTDSEGALPTLYAATATEVEDRGYYGPAGIQEMRGHHVGPAFLSDQARDDASAARLWTVCEELTGVRFL